MQLMIVSAIQLHLQIDSNIGVNYVIIQHCIYIRDYINISLNSIESIN